MKSKLAKNNDAGAHLSPDILLDGPIPLDYAASNEVAEIDRGIRDTIKGIRLSILAMGIGLAKIKAKGLYEDLGFFSMIQYIRRLSSDTKMDSSSIYNWLYIGEAYLKYQNDLEQIGFTDNDGPTKLPYLDRALEKNRKQEVFENIKKMSVREFVVFSKGLSEEGVAERPSVTIRDGVVYVDGFMAVEVNKKLGKEAYAYFRKVNRIAGKAMEAGDFLLPVRLRSLDEVRRYERESIRLIEKLRKKA